MNAFENKEEDDFEDLFLTCNRECSQEQDMSIGQISDNIREYLIVKMEEDIISMIRAISNHQLCISTYTLRGPSFLKTRQKANISVQDYKSFARYLRVLESVYDALVQDTVITKRAIFYGDVELFGSQKVVDQIIEALAANYRVPRNCLNIAAASKGLITGPMSIYLKDGTVLHCHSNPMIPVEGEPSAGLPVLIPSEGRIESIRCDARLVLVIEKETIFRLLLSSNFKDFLNDCILVTGKGYPDVATRYLLNLISSSNVSYGSSQQELHRTMIWNLVDGDPHGIDIHLVYKYGGKAQTHGNDILTCPDIQWLGIRSDDIRNFPISERSKITLNAYDRKKAIAMIANLKQTCYPTDGSPHHLKHRYYHSRLLIRELCCILHQNVKFELEALTSCSSDGLAHYLQSKSSWLGFGSISRQTK